MFKLNSQPPGKDLDTLPIDLPAGLTSTTLWL